MWILSLLLGSVFISGIFADVTSDLEECKENVNLETLESVFENPGAEELETLCPMILGFLDCIEDVVEKHTGLKLAQLAEFIPDPNVQKGFQFIVNLRSVVDDLCTDGTNLNAAYKEHSACFSGVDVDDEVCSDNALAAYEAYKALEANVDDVEENTSEDFDRTCLTEAYKSACIASQIHKECGRDAFDVYQQLVKRASLFSLALCSPEDLEKLKTKFLHSLDLDDDSHDIFRLAFDLRKRRK